jgi:hypothetical protein
MSKIFNRTSTCPQNLDESKDRIGVIVIR